MTLSSRILLLALSPLIFVGFVLCMAGLATVAWLLDFVEVEP